MGKKRIKKKRKKERRKKIRRERKDNEHFYLLGSQFIRVVEAWRSKVDFKLPCDQIFVYRGHLFFMSEVLVYGDR